MVNRRSDQPMGLFNFPFFGNAPRTQPFHLTVRNEEKELVAEGNLGDFDKEDIKIELIRTGLLVIAEKQPVASEKEEEGQTQAAPLPRVERFIPVNFPFTEKDVTATVSEDKDLKIVVAKNDAHRKFINIT